MKIEIKNAMDRVGIVDVIEGNVYRYAKPGEWRIYREGTNIIIEILNNSDEQHSS